MIIGDTCLDPSEVAAQYAEAICNDDSRGYSQPNRYGFGSKVYPLSDGCSIQGQDGDLDCSWLSIICYADQGIDTGDATYTGNMNALVDTGNFVRVSPGEVQRGDILNTTTNGHAAVYLGNGMLAEAHHGDGSRGLSGATGDQDGTEVRVTEWYDDDWTDCYRCTVEREFDAGWIYDGQYWKYRHENGVWAKSCWIEDEGEWYNLDVDGLMRTGWYSEIGPDGAENYYYLYPTPVVVDGKGHPLGAMARSTIVHDNGRPYVITDSGIMARGQTIPVRADMSGALHYR